MYTHKIEEKIRFRDMDVQGHVNNAVYATYLEIGRTDFMYGAPLHDDGCTFVLAQIEIQYLDEVTYPGSVEIYSKVLEIGRSSFKVEQEIKYNNKIVCKAKSVIVQINKTTRKSNPLSQGKLDQLSKYIFDE